MSVLDELRGLIDTEHEWDARNAVDHAVNERVDTILGHLDAFEAAHPGLEDHTVPCPRCGKPTVLNGRYKDRLLGYWREVCPACSEEWQGR